MPYHHPLVTTNPTYLLPRIRSIRQSANQRMSYHSALNFRATNRNIKMRHPFPQKYSPVGAMSLFNLVTDLALGWGTKASTPIAAELRAAAARRQVRRGIMLLLDVQQDFPTQDVSQKIQTRERSDGRQLLLASIAVKSRRCPKENKDMKAISMWSPEEFPDLLSGLTFYRGLGPVTCWSVGLSGIRKLEFIEYQKRYLSFRYS